MAQVLLLMAMHAAIGLGQSRTAATQPAGRLAQDYRVGEIQIAGARIIHPEFLKGSLTLVPGEIFSESRFHNGLAEIRKLYGRLGYINCLPSPVLDFDDIELRVKEK